MNEARHNRAHPVQLHLHKVLEQEKLVYGRKKVTTWLPMGFMDRAGLGEGGRELSGLSENTLYLDMGLG